MTTTMQTMKAAVVAGLLAAAAARAESPTIAVVNFTGPRFADLTSKLPELIEDGLVNGGKFAVVERAKLDSVIEEQGLQHSGQVSEEEQVRLGRLSGARFLLTGSLLDAGDDRKEFNGYGTRLTTTTKRCTVRAKVLDTQTGRSVFSASVDGSYVVNGSSHLHESGDGPWMAMARDLSDKIVRRLHDAEFLKAYQPVQASRVKVHFNTVPAGADVEVDALLVGNGGQEIEVPAGQHVVTVSLPGYQEWKKSAELREGMTINASLKRIQDADVKIAVEQGSAQGK